MASDGSADPASAPPCAVRLERHGTDGRIGVLVVDHPPVNALSQPVRAGLLAGLTEARADPPLEALVLACDGRTFIAGADITEFATGIEDPQLHDVLDALDGSRIPVVAAIHGTAFGGGLEVALACHHRVAVASARCGLPEVKLGLIPGAGGTQRLPRRIGFEPALELITSGRPVDAAEALALGILDAVVEGDDPRAGAIAFAEGLREQGPPPRIRDRVAEVEAARADAGLFERWRERVRAKSRGAEAPLRAVAAIEAAATLPFDEGMARESALIAEAFVSPEAAAMQHLFFAERAAGKVPGLARDTATTPIREAAVIGAGTMGLGIAIALADAGIEVRLVDRSAAEAEAAVEAIGGHFTSRAERGRLAADEAATRAARVRAVAAPDGDLAALAGCDLAIEAVFEDLDLKREVLGALDAALPAHALLATNTSTLDVNRIAAATGRPGQVLGLHFFSPANVMRLVEVVRGERTSDATLASALKLVRRLGKVGVTVGVCDGFVGNRMLAPYRREAAYLVEEGATPWQVDRVLQDFGFPMGPFRMADLAGLDVGWRVRQARGRPTGRRYEGTLGDRLCERGRFGQKSGSGYYRHEGREALPDPEVEELCEAVSAELGITRRAVPDDEITERCLYPMIDEAARILDEGIALRSSDIDVIWALGYGFPAHKGGPCFWADHLGLEVVRDTLRRWREILGPHWTPCELLDVLADEGDRLSSVSKA